jgi:hypothetical protein
MKVMMNPIERILNQKITTKKGQPLFMKIPAESKEMRIPGIL